MKTKLFSKARIIVATLILLSVALVMGFAENSNAYGCPEETSGYQSKGNRKDYTCQHSIVEKGYWWFIEGEVKWVGAVFASMKGSFQAGSKTITINGTQYKCDGFDNDVCWVCNCYSLATPEKE